MSGTTVPGGKEANEQILKTVSRDPASESGGWHSAHNLSGLVFAVQFAGVSLAEGEECGEYSLHALDPAAHI